MGVLRETERSGFADQLDSWSEGVDAEAAQLMRLRVGRGCGLPRGSKRVVGPPFLSFSDLALLHLFVGFTLRHFLSSR